MKSATIPSVRVEPEFRDEIESLLNEGETLSEFVEQSVRDQAKRRRDQAEFVARGIRSLEASKLANDYVESEAVMEGLRQKLAKARVHLADRNATAGKKPRTGR